MDYIPIASDKHPIETGRYIISTNQINNGKAIIYNWINMRIPGAIIYGKQSVGKTKLINYIQLMMEHDLGETIPNYHIKWTKHNSKENAFFETLLDGLNHDIPFEGRPTEKRRRLRNYLLNIVEGTQQNKIIFFIDDAHRLNKMDYEWLMDIYNDLESYGVSLITILVGHDEIIEVLQNLKRARAMQIIGRFMTDDYRFLGFIKEQEYVDLFIEYDERTKFPGDSEITFTQHYFKKQYENGFRLVKFIPEFLKALEHVQIEHNIFEFKEVPAMYVIRSVQNVLKNYGSFGENVSELTIQHWINAIEDSGYIVANANLYKDKVIDDSYLKKI
ncbi:ATP-binding protein [Lysinibacillus irui]|uniref:ATP-binding protein n=1 Tax=Lysinibacillus irui TaxID=2998077 RepID=UPI003883E97B